MRDGRNGGGRKKQPVPEIPFEEIEQNWKPSPLSASFIERDGDDYVINVLTYVGFSPPTIKVDHFRTSADGTVLSAPRGYAKDYKPGRITGLEDALARHGAS